MGALRSARPARAGRGCGGRGLRGSPPAGSRTERRHQDGQTGKEPTGARWGAAFVAPLLAGEGGAGGAGSGEAHRRTDNVGRT